MSSLDLRGFAVLDGERLAREKTEAEELIDRVKQKMAEQGISEYEQPEGRPPSLAEVDVASLSNEDIGRLHAQYVSYASFLMNRVAEAKAVEKVAQSNLKQVTARIKGELISENVSNKEIPDKTLTHPLYKQYEQDYQVAHITTMLTEAIYNTFQKQASYVSRFIKLRELDMQNHQREANVGHIKKGFHSTKSVRKP